MATDPDNDTLTYSFVNPVPGFSIYSNNGSIITSNDLRLSDEQTVVMDIKVSDGSSAADVTTELTLTMTHFNNKPVITNTDTVSVPENTLSGSEIFKCTTQDTTVYDELSYSAVFTPATATAILDFDTDNCAITIKDGQQFDFETESSYSIKITVNDGFKSNDFTIPISIINENDPPKFTRRTYLESAQEGDIGSITFVPAFQAFDPENDPFSYEIVNSSKPGVFSVQNQLTGEISNNVAIDYETLTVDDNPISLIIRVRDATSGEDTATVLVRITDKNDEAPKFASSTNYFNISTSTSMGSKLFTVKAIDKDSPPNAMITYSLKSEKPDAAGHFDVLTNGDVLLKKAVTVPYNGILEAEILATDQGGLSNTTTIKGVWNKGPKILDKSFIAATSKDQTTSKDIFTFKTEDVENDEVTCTIQSVVPTTPTSDQTRLTDAFSVSGSSTPGEFNVRYRGSSFYELDGEHFEINLECADGNGGSDTRKLEVEVAPNKQPTAECSPIDSTEIDALKQNAIDTDVYKLGINDPENDPLHITFTSYPDYGFYRFDSATGNIKVKKDLRLESTDSYQWNLTIIDGNHKVKDGSKTVFVPVQCYIDVTVSDLNVAPIFAKENFEIALPEDTEPGTILHTFDITDVENTTISCDTTPQTEDMLFEIDEKVKTITLAPGKSFDFEGPYKLYSFICVATDGYLSATGSLTISITDTNDKPYFVKPIYTVTVDEGQVGAVKAKPDFQYEDDEKATQSYTYSLNYTEEDASFFDINPTTGEITNIKELDVDADAAKTVLSFTVEITDSLGGVGTTQLDINLRDINDFTPELDPRVYEYELYELLTVGQAIPVKGGAAVTATDKDKEDINKNIVYSLDSANEYFDMSPTGELRLLKSLNGHYNTQFNLKVKATDTGINPGPLSSTALIIFTWNQPLELAGLDDVGKWKEDDIVAGKVPNSDITLTDDDTTDKALLECVTENIYPNTDAFEVRKVADASYAVYYNGRQKLDYRSISKYTVTVRCIDKYGGGSVVKTYDIDVEKNKDPTCPDSDKSTVSADASALTRAGEVIHTIVVEDEDKTTVKFNLVSRPPNGATPAFRVGRFDGKITTTMNLGFVDREPARELLVQVTDNHQNSVTCTIVVNIENMNEPPKFDNLPTTEDVEETAKIDDKILKVTLTDDECGDVLDLTWTVQPSGNRDFFTVEISDTGKEATVKVGKELDHETEPTQYRITFRATDGCLAENSQVLTVNVKDVNEPPTFSKGDKYFANISEKDTGIIDLDCRGIDPDQGDELTLEIKGPQAKYFKVIDAAKCQIQLVGDYPLDKPDNVDGKNIELEMTLKDKAGSGTPPDDPTSTATATATINIWDYNDNTPLFDQAAYKGTDIVSGDPVGKFLGKVAATDKDFEEKTNGRIEYYLEGCSNGGDPYIGVLGDGTIRLKQDLATSGIPYGTIFSCSIKAIDKGIYPGTLYSTTLFDVVYQEPPEVVNTIIVPVTQDPGTGTGAGAEADAGAGADAKASVEASSSSEDFLKSPAAIAMLSLLGVALLALLLFLCCRFCLGNCGGGGSGMCCNNGSDIVGGDNYSSRPGSGGHNSVRPSPVMHP
ncbi:protocadherin Fat 2 isoform X4 [Patella vulgata]|uniref:protocadherin Fat 2 isoform X4 n=1 Tax=Patella vulgata TaxID=6465 RepID=UPI0024A82A85|nr:protocadherin Fat 2 isoform X4 [Patella vulgata]